MQSSSHHTWDEASSPAAVGLARQFEADWRGSPQSNGRPEPDDYLGPDPSRRPGDRLALLRADLGLRWEMGQRVGVEWYRDRYPDLSDETLVALIYEEFCLREEEQGKAEPDEYYARFPEVAPQLRRVLDIHGLVGSGATTALHISEESEVALPETGQTIGGFHLVEELGRGAFARVFLAQERQLADRPVALKVTRNGSPEPRTLARLQHTHIVPIYSYRTDPATDLHLLCMPFFGRVTLAHLLDDPQVKTARHAAEVLESLDRLDPPARDRSRRGPSCRKHFATLPYARALAWWGAGLAEALQHAHDRGILHRDIKPSNVLVTPDGMPMLLDFNLAQSERAGAEDSEPAALGGTLAYMAPEHLEALADGDPDRVDGRADLYALGVVLFEAMGTRPFPAQPGQGAGSLAQALQRAADDRRRGAPRLGATHDEAPPAFEAVVRKCLEPDPADRYPDAAALAEDLRAVAEDRPLRWAREPLPSRTVRWVRRNRIRMAVAAPALLTLLALAFAIFQAKVAAVDRRHEVSLALLEGKSAESQGRYDLAAASYQTAMRMAEGTASLIDLRQQAVEGYFHAGEANRVLNNTIALLEEAGRLRFTLLGFTNDDESDDVATLRSKLEPFHVLVHENWTTLPELTLLPDDLHEQLVAEVEELLFFWAVSLAANPRSDPAAAVVICDKALVFSRTPGPWRALRERTAARAAGRPPRLMPEPDPRTEESAWACFQWGLIRQLVDRAGLDRAIAWLDRSVWIDPTQYWAHYFLAYNYDHSGQPDAALRHYEAAISRQPRSPWAHLSRAQLYWKRGAWGKALEDLDKANKLAGKDPFTDVWLERGIILLHLGDLEGARQAFDDVVEADGPRGPLGLSARLNRAVLEFENGDFEHARAEYDALLAESRGREEGESARLARAQLALRMDRPAEAEADLSRLLANDPHQPEYLGLRALARLAQDRAAEAEVDARHALALDPNAPSRERLWIRALLASGRAEDLQLDRPSVLRELPGPRQTVRAELRAAARRLESSGDDPLALRNRAVILAALGDPRAGSVANRAVMLDTASPRALLVRARVRRLIGDRDGAREDVADALALDPDEPRLLELRGVLAFEAGDPHAALADLDRAVQLQGTPTVQAHRGEVLLALNRPREAEMAWSAQLAIDPESPAAFLGRARAFERLDLWDQALADLEAAIGESADRPKLLVRITLAYAACLHDRPDRLPRVVSLARRALVALVIGD